ncbi:response regulator transcription factor [Eubacteriales bacterium OttesenSCG-928-A19]|nr:response regulator transcription factor [Eubacteriales bacterium OttesenSCG-928-A19]
MADKIRILIVDDNEDIRAHFVSILSKEPRIEIVAEAASGADSVTMAMALAPDVVLMDIQMETPTAGIDAAQRIHESLPETRIIILTIHEEDELLFQAYCAGVMDYIVKTDSIATIIRAIENVYENKMLLRPQIAEKIVQEFTRMKANETSLLYAINLLSRLTNSEFEILSLIFSGQRYKEIAASRYVSLSTVKSQINSILRKLEMKSMKDAMRMLHQISFGEIIRERGTPR